MRRYLLPILYSLFCMCAGSAQAQTYVRPSKGTPITVLDTTNPTTTKTSAVYDMSAFSEIQIEDKVTKIIFGAPVPFTKSFAVSGLGRYIQILVSYINTGTGPYSSTVQVLSSDTPNGPFRVLDAPGAITVVSVYPNNTIAQDTLIVTPIPFTSIQYNRPAKGNELVFWQSTGFDSMPFFRTGTIPMKGFSALGITFNIQAVSPGCKYDFYIQATSTKGGISTPGTRYYITGDDSRSWAFNVPTEDVELNITRLAKASPGPNDCKVTISAVPLPYTISSADYPQTFTTNVMTTLPGAGTSVPINIGLFGNLNVRFQPLNTTQRVDCSTNDTDFPIRLKGESSSGAGDSGVFLLTGVYGTVYCKTNGPNPVTLGVFQY